MSSPHDDLMPFALGLAAAIAEQDTKMVATMRRDWDETGALPIVEAHRRHRQIAEQSGFAGVGSDTLNQHMSAVVDRAHRQGAGESS